MLRHNCIQDNTIKVTFCINRCDQFAQVGESLPGHKEPRGQGFARPRLAACPPCLRCPRCCLQVVRRPPPPVTIARQISRKSSNQANLKFAWRAKFNFVCFRSRMPLLHNTHLIWGSTKGPSFLSDPRLIVVLPCPLTHLVRLFKPCAPAMLSWK